MQPFTGLPLGCRRVRGLQTGAQDLPPHPSEHLLAGLQPWVTQPLPEVLSPPERWRSRGPSAQTSRSLRGNALPRLGSSPLPPVPEPRGSPERTASSPPEERQQGRAERVGRAPHLETFPEGNTLPAGGLFLATTGTYVGKYSRGSHFVAPATSQGRGRSGKKPGTELLPTTSQVSLCSLPSVHGTCQSPESRPHPGSSPSQPAPHRRAHWPCTPLTLPLPPLAFAPGMGWGQEGPQCMGGGQAPGCPGGCRHGVAPLGGHSAERCFPA